VVIAEALASFTACNVGGPGLIVDMNVFGTDATLFSRYNSYGLREHMELLTVPGYEEIDLNTVGAPDKNEHFLECLISGSKSLATALDARNALAVVEAAYASMRKGERVSVNRRNAWEEATGVVP